MVRARIIKMESNISGHLRVSKTTISAFNFKSNRNPINLNENLVIKHFTL